MEFRMAEQNSPQRPHPAPSQRRYPPELKQRAVRMVCELREQDPADHTVVSRVARQLNVGAESLRSWVKADERGGAAARPAPNASEQELAALRRENRELRRANEILVAASGFFAAELDRRQHK
jgi:transposase